MATQTEGHSAPAPSTPHGGETPRPAHTVGEFQHAYEEDGKLLGYACACGFKSFTYVLRCPRCHTEGGLKDAEFKGTGTVVACTLQTVPADEFVNDAPYFYALVHLDEGINCSGWVPTAKAIEDLKIGDRVHWLKSYKLGMVFEKGEG